jgi:hypothetical protein
MPENVEVAVVGTNLEDDVLRAVPLIDYFLHKIFPMIQSKANWPFVPLAARVAVNVQLHLIIVAQDPMWLLQGRFLFSSDASNFAVRRLVSQTAILLVAYGIQWTNRACHHPLIPAFVNLTHSRRWI